MINSVIKDSVNREYIKCILEGIVKSGINCAITGNSGTGKNTLLCSLIEYLESKKTLKVYDSRSLDYVGTLRKIYPSKNILELNNKFVQEKLDLVKNKKEETVIVINEVANSMCSFNLIYNMYNVSSNLFTNYANTTENLVDFFTSSLVMVEDTITNYKKAQKVVLCFLFLDIHMCTDMKGQKYIERITEIVPDSENYKIYDIIRYDSKEDKYYKINNPSARLEEKMNKAKVLDAVLLALNSLS